MMKRTPRRNVTRASELSPQTRHKQTGGRKRPVRRGKPQKCSNLEISSSASDRSFQEDFHDESASAHGYAIGNSTPNKHSKTAVKPKGNGRLNTAFCRLCHGKFSKRRLRHAFDKQLEESMEVDDFLDRDNNETSLLFCTDFQRLLGVPMNRDPRLSSFICKTCHAQFYKCNRILADFRKRVNHTPTGHEGNRERGSVSVPAVDGCTSTTCISSDPKCLHSLVSWAHSHAEACHSCPNLREVLEDQCWGSVKAVWGCLDGHSYVMDANGISITTNPGHTPGAVEQGGRDGSHKPKTPRKPSHSAATATTSTVQPSPATTPQVQHSSDLSSPSTDGLFPNEEIPLPVAAQPVEQTADSDLSDRNFSSDEEYVDRRKTASSDDLAYSYPPKRAAPAKRRPKAAKPPAQPKERKKPGPKKKPKSEREELPTIYKCPYQGCTAVYRGSDGMKKHIKEHHEEVRERPCPHPGCNKVFMIDRYLQRHVKLIHTEERNYICDQCGQTFKQRKHLSVHQMRHSGAKPLQCEVCGFQCRQRASLKYHMTKHKAEADLEFACALCGKRFEKAHNLNVHMSMVHPLTQGGSNDTPTTLGHPTSDPDRSRQSTRSTETQQAPPLQIAEPGPASQDTQRTTLASPDMSYMLESL